MAGWDTNRPIYDRLPGENGGYREEEAESVTVADLLTQPWDDLLMETKGAIDHFERDYLDPATALPQHLDWLAQLCGFTGDYWDSDWAVPIKRQLIERSYSFIWENKGSRDLMEWLLATFGLNAQIYLQGEFLAGITRLPGTVGGDGFWYLLTVQLIYLRSSPEWKLLERLNRLYGPVYCESRVCYDQFYAGFSVAGDPVFRAR